MANKVLSDRDEMWDDLPVHVIEAEIEFEKPLVAAIVSQHKWVIPAFDFDPKEDWKDTFMEHMKAVKESTESNSHPFDPEDFKDGHCFGCAVILHTPTRVSCTAMVFPVRIAFEDLILLASASIVKGVEERDEYWETGLVHVVEAKLPMDSSVYMVFPEPKKPLYFLSTTPASNIVLHKLTRSRALLPQEVKVSLELDLLWEDVKNQMRDILIQKPRLSPDDVGFLDHSLVVIVRHPEGASYSVALLPLARTMADLLLMVPATLVMEPIPQGLAL